MSNIMDKIIADFVEGARRSEGIARGGHARVELAREDHGREEKIASVGGAIGGGLLGGGAGALGGGLAGAGTGALLGKLLHLQPEMAQELGGLLSVGGAAVGGLGGAAGGAAAGSESRHPSLLERLKGGALTAHYDDGAKAAVDRLGVKEALLPLVGSLAGGALLRGGLGMAARRFGGSALGRGAQGALDWAGKGGMRGGALDMAGSMAGGAVGNMLQGGQ